MNKINVEIGNLESYDIHAMNYIRWLVTQSMQTKQIEISIAVENKEGYVVLRIDEETWENLKEGVDEMIYEMCFGDKDG